MTISTAIKMTAAVALLSFTTASTQAGDYLVKPSGQSSTRLVKPSGQSGTYLVKPHVSPRLHIHPERDVPKLGFYGKQTHYGMKVVDVVRGTEAYRIGLEEGDVILSIDGYHLHDDGDYERALRRAGDRAALRVKDVRGRGIFIIYADLDRCRDGEIRYYSYRD